MIVRLSAALLTLSFFATPLAAQHMVDAAQAQNSFGICKACHRIGENAKNAVGPELNGIIGRPAGSIEGFKYSDAMTSKAAEGLVWDEASLFEYLKDPSAFIGGKSKMTLKVSDETKRHDIIAYLKQFNAEGEKAQ